MSLFVEEREQHLETLLSRLLRNNPSEADSPLRLQAYTRLYAALYRFLAINNNDDRYGSRREFTRRAEDMFRLLLRKASCREISLTERARLIAALYYLSTEAMPFYDARRDELSGEALAGLMEDLSGKSTTDDAMAQILVCRCLTSALYPELCPEDDWSAYLQNKIKDWVGALSAEGAWNGLPANIAVERIEVMNRYSYLFLDNSYDGLIKQGRDYYIHLFSESRLADATGSLYEPACCYDLVMQGNACPVNWKMADSIATAFYQGSLHYSAGSDEWCYCLSYYVAHLCEQITEYYQHEMLESIV